MAKSPTPPARSPSKAPAKTPAKSTTKAVTLGMDSTVSVRKIENGYVVRTSEYSRGKYKESEVYTKSPPKVQVK